MPTSSRPLAAVTGASSGIGLALAKEFARHGHDLLLVARSDHRLDQAERELRALGAKVWSLSADLGTAAGVEETHRFLQRQGRPLAALVCNAGRGLGGDFVGETSWEDEQALLQRGVVATVHLAKRVLPAMVAAGHGRMLFTVSFTPPTQHEVVQEGTRAFITAFVAALQAELADSGVTLAVLLPEAGAPETLDLATVAAHGYAALTPTGTAPATEGHSENAAGDTPAHGE